MYMTCILPILFVPNDKPYEFLMFAGGRERMH